MHDRCTGITGRKRNIQYANEEEQSESILNKCNGGQKNLNFYSVNLFNQKEH